MLEGGDSSRGNLGAWRQVSAPFSSNIAARVERLASHIQDRLARYLYFTRRPYLPIWLPDYSTLTSAHWSESLVAKVYDTIQSLPGIRHLAPPLRVEPSPFAWFRPGRGWPEMPEEDDHVVTEAGTGFEAPAFQPDGFEFHQLAGPRASGEGHIVSGPYIRTTPQPHRTWKKAPLFMPRPRPPITALRPIGLWPGVKAEPDAAIGKGPTPHLTHPGLVDGGKSILSAIEDTTGPGELISPMGHSESPVAWHHDRLRPPILPRTLRRAMSTSRISGALPGVQKVIAFTHRLVVTPPRVLRDEGVTPATFSAGGTDAHPLIRTEGAAPTGIGRVTPSSSDERIEPSLADPVSSREAGWISPSAIGGDQQFGAWLHGRRHPASRATSLEQAYLAGEAEVQTGLPVPSYLGLEFGPARMASLSPEFVFPSVPAGRPASSEDSALQAMQPATSQRFILPQHGPPPKQRVPISAPHSLADTVAINATGGGEQGVTSFSGGSSYGVGVGKGLALAPIGRPSGTSSDVSAPAEVIAESAAGHQEGAEEAAEPNLDRLARDVYVVLKRRLAWEKERSLVLRS